MRPMLLALPAAVAVLSSSVCEAAPRSARVPRGVPCQSAAARVANAANSQDAIRGLRSWNRCVWKSGETRPDHDELMRSIVDANRFGAVIRAKSEILGHFSDTSRLRELPSSYQGTRTYLQLLDDQGLYCRGKGDLELANKIDARAEKTRHLLVVLDKVYQD